MATNSWAALALVHFFGLCALLFWLYGEARPVPMHDVRLDAGEKLRCVSYAPFHRRGQTPFDAHLEISRQQIVEDLGALAAIADCVRTYAIDMGLEEVPAVARALGLKVLLGTWIGYERDRNARHLERAIALANEYRDVVRALIVGNEVLLRRELDDEAMRALLASARARSAVPVTYADVWEFWLKHDELADAVDFITIHILPFWEDEPVDIGQALVHVAETRARVSAHFAGKSILIGETGWPGAGRQRGESRPSKVNQARYVREFVQRAHAEGWDYNLIEAIDQPWKRRQEGTVGGYWGMLDAATLRPKFALAGPVAERDSLVAPLAGAIAGAALALLLALAGGHGAHARSFSRLAAVTLTGATSGLIAVLHGEHARLAYQSVTDWGALGAVAVAAVCTCAALARWRGEVLAPADLAWRRVRRDRLGASAADVLSVLRGFILFAAAVAALLLLVSGRYRDFPSLLYLTPAAIYGVIGWRREGGFSRDECICAGIIVFCALARWLPEPANPQAAGWMLTGLALALPALGQPFGRRLAARRKEAAAAPGSHEK
ncbi:MAG: beta-1,6-glucan synthase [Azoarcus sp.]|nr:beta-1,6-glucan synthase [Azoarcus sp.]